MMPDKVTFYPLPSPLPPPPPSPLSLSVCTVFYLPSHDGPYTHTPKHPHTHTQTPTHLSHPHDHTPTHSHMIDMQICIQTCVHAIYICAYRTHVSSSSYDTSSSSCVHIAHVHALFTPRTCAHPFHAHVPVQGTCGWVLLALFLPLFTPLFALVFDLVFALKLQLTNSLTRLNPLTSALVQLTNSLTRLNLLTSALVCTLVFTLVFNVYDII
jgi:hypothetical protein